jgi:hypothetical protein
MSGEGHDIHRRMGPPTPGRLRVIVFGLMACLALVAASTAPAAVESTSHSTSWGRRVAEEEPPSPAEVDGTGGESASEMLAGAAWYSAIRTAPSGRIPRSAIRREWASVASLPTVGGAWTELTDVPYQTESPTYRNPQDSFWGSGYGMVGGRVQALAVDGDTVYAGAANGGVWRSTDRGKTWTPVSDDLPSLSSGDLAIDPSNGDVWYGTGEASTMFMSYPGAGVFRSTDGGDTWEQVGGHQLDATLIGAIELDGLGHVYAATSRGLFRRSTTEPDSDAWTLVLRPGTPEPYGMTFTNDVVVRPGTGGRVVVASLGWRSGPTDYSGLYVSRDQGQEGTWRRVATRGDLDPHQIGRASVAYSSDGSRLYALVESWQYNMEQRPSSLYGVFLSPNGAVGGPWVKIAGANELVPGPGGDIYGCCKVGVQAWYNQAIGVDPSDRDHVYVGLEELYETTDAGDSWITAGPYFTRCLEGPDACPNTTHPDQQALAFGDGVVYAGNDGGVYRRSLTHHTAGVWKNLNHDLHALQYYAAGVGNAGAGDVMWGGTQDNGITLLRPGADTMVAPLCCDGFNLIVDPANPDRAVIGQIDMGFALTTRGGVSDGTTRVFRPVSPFCGFFSRAGAAPCDPQPHFVAPLRADPLDPDHHWVTGARYVWESSVGWPMRRGGEWEIVHGVGSHNGITALDVNGDTIYAGWCGPIYCDPSPEFATGIDTNAGGTWHRVAGPDISNGGVPLPNRWITAVTIDPADPNHVYVTYGGYQRHWNFVPGSGGHVFESNDGGETWSDASGDLPDAPATDLVIVGGKLVVSMDVGVFVADASDPSTWSNLGVGMPHTSVNDLTLTPDNSSIVAATHGRGLWSTPAP